MAKEKHTKKGLEEIYLRCNDCQKIVFTPLGAITHAKKKHGLSLSCEDVMQSFAVVKKPSQEIIDEIQRKRAYQKRYNQQTRYKKKSEAQSPVDGGGETRFKCNACGLVVSKKVTLYSHCRRQHKKPLSKIGFTETTEPLTNPNRQYTRKAVPADPIPLTNLIQNMPQVVDIPNAEVTEDGVILTIRVKITPSYVAAVIIPSVTQ